MLLLLAPLSILSTSGQVRLRKAPVTNNLRGEELATTTRRDRGPHLRSVPEDEPDLD